MRTTTATANANAPGPATSADPGELQRRDERLRALENELERMRGREFELEMRRVQSGARPRLPAWAKAALILVVLAAAGGTALLYSVVSTSADLRVREAEQRLERVRERAEQQVETALAVAATARDRLRGAQDRKSVV